MRQVSAKRAASVVLFTVAFLAAACGGDDSSGSGAGQTTTSGATQQAGASTAASSAPSADPKNMDEWEALWEKQRAAIVKRIKDNKWGLQADGKTVVGPDGFQIDLNKCQQGWSNTEGLTDTSIKMSGTVAESGTFADSANVAKGMGVVYDYYGAKGFFTDSIGKNRKINWTYKDDGYDAARTVPLVAEILDSEHAFTIWTLGTQSTMKTYDNINARCVPHLFAATGHPAWGDPVNHPWTTGSIFAYNTEAVMWGSFLEQHINEFPGGKVKVAALVMNNDFGVNYNTTFKAFLAQSPMKDRITYVTESIEAQAPNATDPMTSLAAQKPDVFISMTAGTPCSQLITEAAQNGMKQSAKYLFTPSVCKQSNNVGAKAVGDASDGWWTMGGGQRDLNSVAEDNTPWIVWARDQLKAAGIDPKSSGNLGLGMSIGWGYAQILNVAGQLNGGLTRANLMVATRAMDMTNPYYLTGIRWNLDGAKDAYWIEGTDVSQWSAANQRWEQKGDVVELSGKSSTCAWDQAVSQCK
jgi:ABC-type branched-subunit amino acid transport system substrate-binding protein